MIRQTQAGSDRRRSTIDRKVSALRKRRTNLAVDLVEMGRPEHSGIQTERPQCASIDEAYRCAVSPIVPQSSMASISVGHQPRELNIGKGGPGPDLRESQLFFGAIPCLMPNERLLVNLDRHRKGLVDIYAGGANILGPLVGLDVAAV